jgi:hypothetical protein
MGKFVFLFFAPTMIATSIIAAQPAPVQVCVAVEGHDLLSHTATHVARRLRDRPLSNGSSVFAVAIPGMNDREIAQESMKQRCEYVAKFKWIPQQSLELTPSPAERVEPNTVSETQPIFAGPGSGNEPRIPSVLTQGKDLLSYEVFKNGQKRRVAGGIVIPNGPSWRLDSYAAAFQSIAKALTH